MLYWNPRELVYDTAVPVILCIVCLKKGCVVAGWSNKPCYEKCIAPNPIPFIGV